MTAIPEPRSPNTPKEMSVSPKDTTSMGLPYIHCHSIVSYNKHTVTRERSPEYYFGIVAGWV